MCETASLGLQAFQAAEGILSYGMTRTSGVVVLAAWLLILVCAMVMRAATDYSDHYAQPLHWFETFYRIGSLIYGGGQVVLPMLLTETVQYSCFVDDHGKRVRCTLNSVVIVQPWDIVMPSLLFLQLEFLLGGGTYYWLAPLLASVCALVMHNNYAGHH
jgi:hypothetical protein